MSNNPFDILANQLQEIQASLQIIDKKVGVPHPQNDDKDQLYTVGEICKKFGVTRVTLWQWEKKGILRAVRIGNLKRYKKSDIENFINKK